ncbi:MAG: twin-arginine translocation signal domain-containing protein, partial [Bacteroidaceae bacterium]|nr:twin-arginine translocation signal domain-containing protein [Bacteroidaceae bacterium]
MDRRNFLKRTTAGAGLLAVSPSLQTLDAATRKKKKVKTRLPVEG